MRGLFKSIVKRLKLRRAVFPLKCRFQQQVAELRVLREHRPMAVSAENVLEMRTLGAVLTVVAEAGNYLTQRLDT